MRILAITQARTGSSRLPGKVLKTIAGKTLLQIHLDRLSRTRLVEKIVVATTVEPADTAIAELVSGLGCEYFRGSEMDVLDRYYQAARVYEPEYIVRVTSDCPLIDPAVVDDVITALIASGSDYASNCFDRTFPDGMDAEAFRFSALERAWQEASIQRQREHVTPYIVENSDQRGGNLFHAASVRYGEDFSGFRLTIDYPEDFALLQVLVGRLGPDLGWRSYADFLAQNPDVFGINQRFGTTTQTHNPPGDE
jgi:spore coat polysaccharide biosynthesis protein SpsF